MIFIQRPEKYISNYQMSLNSKCIGGNKIICSKFVDQKPVEKAISTQP
jgi:hypothetical protein